MEPHSGRVPETRRGHGAPASACPCEEVPRGFCEVGDTSLLEAYYGWVHRVLKDHESRYSKVKVDVASRSDQGQGRGRAAVGARSLYNQTLAGYYSRDEASLAKMSGDSALLTVYSRLSNIVHAHQSKKLAVSPLIDLRKGQGQPNATVFQHVQGFEALAQKAQVDIVAVQEGRGQGKGCYYWPGQEGVNISQVDPVLDQVLHYLQPSLPPNVTFQEVFTASNQQVFSALSSSQASLQARRRWRQRSPMGTDNSGLQQQQGVSLWLGVEAYEYLRDDPCLPVDIGSSGVGQILNRASKGRVDRSVGGASVHVQKVVSMAWDPEFTCTTRRYASTLAAQIRASDTTPLIANCSFHSPANRSVVIIGYNLELQTIGFEINWPSHGQRRVSHLWGYYYELDWGLQHRRVPSLEYTQLYDLPNVLADLDPKGWVKVKAANSVCLFQYDFSTNTLPSSDNNGKNPKLKAFQQGYRGY